MQSEEAVEIEAALAAARPRDGDASARAVVAEVAVWHDHAQPVHGAALEDGDEDLGPGGPALRVRRADEKARDGAQTEQGQGAALHERAPRAVTVHGLSPLEFRRAQDEGRELVDISIRRGGIRRRAPRRRHPSVVGSGADDLRIVELSGEHRARLRPRLALEQRHEEGIQNP